MPRNRTSYDTAFGTGSQESAAVVDVRTPARCSGAGGPFGAGAAPPEQAAATSAAIRTLRTPKVLVDGPGWQELKNRALSEGRFGFGSELFDESLEGLEAQ